MRHFLIVILAVVLLLGATPAMSQNATLFDKRIPELPAGADVTPRCPAGSMPSVLEDAKDSQQEITCVPMPQAANMPAPTDPVEQTPIEHASQSPVPSSPIASIGAGGMLFGKRKMGCYAELSKDGKTRLMPFFEEKTGEWIEADHYGMKQALTGVDVYMVCTTSADGLTVMFTAQSFAPTFFSTKWFQ
jgi:hypothetical protein